MIRRKDFVFLKYFSQEIKQKKCVLNVKGKDKNKDKDKNILLGVGSFWPCVRWSRWSERNVGAANALSIWLSTDPLFVSMASLEPPLFPYEEFFGVACIWSDSWKSKSQPLLLCGQAAANYFFFTHNCIFQPCWISQLCCTCSASLWTWTIDL